MHASWVAVGLAACALTSCSTLRGTTGQPPQVVLGPAPTGELPAPLSTEPVLVPPSTVVATTTSTPGPIEPLDGPIADEVAGNRVLIIGDTVLAATAPRNDGEICRALQAFGWDIELDAEPGRFVDFALTVLEQRLQPDDGLDWDVVVIMLGNHFDEDVDAFEATLDETLAAVAPRPVVLYTVTERIDGQAEINDFIRSRVRFRPNVVVIDWAESTAAEPDVLLDGDGFEPTSDGADRLALFLAAALGRREGDEQGACLDPVFVDDSAIVL